MYKQTVPEDSRCIAVTWFWAAWDYAAQNEMFHYNAGILLPLGLEHPVFLQLFLEKAYQYPHWFSGPKWANRIEPQLRLLGPAGLPISSAAEEKFPGPTRIIPFEQCSLLPLLPCGLPVFLLKNKSDKVLRLVE